MSAKKFKFISPGVFLNEIDNTQLSKASDAVGPVIIGRARKGPSLRPVRVESFSEFVEVFGKPEPGGSGEDVWRQGNGFLAPTYAPYAAQAYLRNSGPINFVRLLGVEDPDALTAGKAGWAAVNKAGEPGSYGIFLGSAPSTKASFKMTVNTKPAQDTILEITDASSTPKVKVFQVRPAAGCGGVLEGNGCIELATDTQLGFAQGLKAAVETAVDANQLANIEISILDKTTAANDRAIVVEIRSTIAGSSGLACKIRAGEKSGGANQFTQAMINQFNGYLAGTPFNNSSDGAYTNFSQSYATRSDAHLAAIVYTNPPESTDAITVKLRGNPALKDTSGAVSAAVTEANAAVLAKSGQMFDIVISNSDGSTTTEQALGVSFDPSSPKFIRKVLNTNPTQTNQSVVAATEDYWLGETFEQAVASKLSAAGHLYAFTAPLMSGSVDHATFREPVKEAKSGWFFSQNIKASGSFAPANQQKLFRICSLNEGESNNRDFKVSIQDIKAPAKGGVNPYGSFTVLLRKAEDSDNAPQIVERFSNCNLNPLSSDYIGRKIGDMYQEWKESEKRYRFYGDYANMSRYVRVEVHADVHNGVVEPSLLPFGVFGPPVYRDSQIGNSANGEFPATEVTNSDAGGFPIGGANKYSSKVDKVIVADTATSANLKINVKMPRTRLRVSGSDGGMVNPSKAFFGLQTTRTAASTRHDTGYVDLVRRLPEDWSANAYVPNTAASPENKGLDHAWTFTLDDIVISGSTVRHEPGSHAASSTGPYYVLGNTGKAYAAGSASDLDSDVDAYYYPVYTTAEAAIEADIAAGGQGEEDTLALSSISGVAQDPAVNLHIPRSVVYGHGITPTGLTSAKASRTNNHYAVTVANWSKVSGSVQSKYNAYNVGWSHTAVNGYESLLGTEEISRFTSPMFGGTDGVDVTEPDAFNNRELTAAAGSDVAKYEYASVKRALSSVSDAEVIESNLICMPGITEPTLTTAMIRNAEARADQLAVIDLPDVYIPPHELTTSTTEFKDRVPNSVQQVSDAFSNRGINSSYGCTYYPWVKIYDETSDAQVWVPPSIIALGVFANTERKSALWFAPAGFNRGGLTEGSAGLPVIGVTERLTSKDRDKLYDVNINPIATFPAEGIVVFGQKTLQISQSALDRINVRRLLIFVKKRVSRIANSLLFDQNVQSTWDRFTGQVQPFLERVKQGFGLTDFKVVLDKSTTTPDLVDRNIMYAKIFLKPARSIEFIAIDFVITNTGAAFED